ncbi:hypothetical protein ACO2Q3_03775 [Caulobacter sp. KR2-114]|uniref:hypothetical protein n=1 Tax=Caulobacter sp. KR2-114 TaxID=3400912 RepID=UPI003C0355A3
MAQSRTARQSSLDGGDGVSLRDLARRLAEELDSASEVAQDCQGALGEVVEKGLTERLAVRLQALDLLSQRLDELSMLLKRLERLEGAGSIPMHMFANMRLTDVSRRLMGADEISASEREAEFW